MNAAILHAGIARPRPNSSGPTPDFLLRALKTYPDLSVYAVWGECDKCRMGYTGEWTGSVCGDLSYAGGDPAAAPCSGTVVGVAWGALYTCFERRDTKRWEFYCDRCSRWHAHDAEEGLRQSHCHGKTADHNQYAIRLGSGKRSDIKTRNYEEQAAAKYVMQHMASVPKRGRKIVRVADLLQTAHSPISQPAPTWSRPMNAVVRFHRNEKSTAISTNASTEQEFMAAIASAVAVEVIGSTDPEEILANLLPQIVEIACKLRGYKSNVTEHRVIIAGQIVPEDVVDVFSSFRSDRVVAGAVDR
jgi:hypothetical protein